MTSSLGQFFSAAPPFFCAFEAGFLVKTMSIMSSHASTARV